MLIVYRRKPQRSPQLVAGILFMVYPYFTPGVLSMLLVGVALGTGLWVAVQGGW